MTATERRVEAEFRNWSETPLWYCVITVLYNNGKIEGEIMTDRKTKTPVVLRGLEKPLDGAYETDEAITYYTYHQGYAEARRFFE